MSRDAELVSVQPTPEEDAALLVCPRCKRNHFDTGLRCRPDEKEEE